MAGAAYCVWHRMRPRRFAFGVEVASGASRYLLSQDEGFIDRVLVTVTSYFEKGQSGGTQVNFVDRSIHVLGDNYGDLTSGDRR